MTTLCLATCLSDTFVSDTEVLVVCLTGGSDVQINSAVQGAGTDPTAFSVSILLRSTTAGGQIPMASSGSTLLGRTGGSRMIHPGLM